MPAHCCSTNQTAHANYTTTSSLPALQHQHVIYHRPTMSKHHSSPYEAVQTPHSNLNKGRKHDPTKDPLSASTHNDNSPTQQGHNIFPELHPKHEELVCYCCLLYGTADMIYIRPFCFFFPSTRKRCSQGTLKTVHLADKKRQGP